MPHGRLVVVAGESSRT